MFVLLGSVNLFVALFNFIPLLPLDGGHIVGALYEGLKQLLARLRGRPDPGLRRHGEDAAGGVRGRGLILISGVVLILADLIDPITLF